MTVFIERSKTGKTGEGAEVAIPRGWSQATCAVTALKAWLQATKISRGPLFRKINKAGRAETRRLSADVMR